MMNGWLKSFVSSGQVWRFAWVGLLAGVAVLAQYAYTEHDRRLIAEQNSPVLALPIIRELNADRRAVQAGRDSLQQLLNQCQGREALTLLNYQTYQANEATRIAAARHRAAADSGDQQQRKLADRYKR